MSHVQGVHHVAVCVPDIEVAHRFYVDLLGAEQVHATEWERGNPFINEIVGLPDSAGEQRMYRLANTYIETFHYREPEAPPQDPARPVNRYGYTHFGLQVDDIDAVYQRMLAAGLRFHCPPKHLGEATHDAAGRRIGFRSTYGRDFFGNVFELMEMGPGSGIAPL